MVSLHIIEKTVRQPNNRLKAIIQLAGTFAIIVRHLILLVLFQVMILF